MKRREFITLLGGAAVAWPVAARSEQSALPVIGFLSSASPDAFAPFVAGFHQGLRETGYSEGQNLAVEYRWAFGHYDRLPALAADLVGHRVAVLVTTGGAPSALAGKGATKSIPVLFITGSDPVILGLVTSLNRPGGNITGVNWFSYEVTAKRLGLLQELLPHANPIGRLVNAKGPESRAQFTDAQKAARTLGRELILLNASTESEIDTAFETLVRERGNALVVTSDPFFSSQRNQLLALATRHAMPTSYSERGYAAAGGLISYGASRTNAYHHAGIYAGRVLKGEKPADLPVVLPTKLELVINLKTAKALGLEVPAALTRPRPRGDRIWMPDRPLSCSPDIVARHGPRTEFDPTAVIRRQCPGQVFELRGQSTHASTGRSACGTLAATHGMILDVQFNCRFN